MSAEAARISRMAGGGPQPAVLAGSALSAAAAFGLAIASGNVRAVYGVGIGLFAGYALYRAAFGFTGGWRRLVTERDPRGFHAQLALIACVSLVSLPLTVYGPGLGLRTGGFVFPFGVGAMVGAALFGVGMQLGGGCGSGTLFTAGGGSVRMVLTLAGFVFGSLIGTLHLPWWNGLPRAAPVSLVDPLGPWGALMATLAGLGLVAAAARAWTRARACDRARPGESATTPGPARSRAYGVAALTIVCLACFILLGRPWGITSGFALWGAKIASALGVSVETWPYWRGRTGAIERSVMADTTSAMNVGVMLGALGAAGVAGRFAPSWRIAPESAATAVIGGVLMGYGARLSYGCNIGAYLGGITSGSLHGWAWFACAFAGSTATVLIRKRHAR